MKIILHSLLLTLASAAIAEDIGSVDVVDACAGQWDTMEFGAINAAVRDVGVQSVKLVSH